VGFTHRYSSVAVAAKSFIDAGRLGKVYHAKANYYRRRGIPGLGGWFTTKALSGGGPLIDLGVHIIDLSTYLMGFPKPVRVSGKVYANFGKRMKKYVYESMWAGPPRFDGVCDVEDAAHALVRFEGGLTLEMNTTWAMNYSDETLPNVIGLFGDQGGLTFGLGGSDLKLAYEDQGHNVDTMPLLRKTDPFADQLRTFIGHCEKRTQPHASGQSGQVVQSILDAIYQSSAKDREVEV
jgi:predicted dehydrogenase